MWKQIYESNGWMFSLSLHIQDVVKKKTQTLMNPWEKNLWQQHHICSKEFSIDSVVKGKETQEKQTPFYLWHQRSSWFLTALHQYTESTNWHSECSCITYRWAHTHSLIFTWTQTSQLCNANQRCKRWSGTFCSRTASSWRLGDPPKKRKKILLPDPLRENGENPPLCAIWIGLPSSSWELRAPPHSSSNSSEQQLSQEGRQTVQE